MMIGKGQNKKSMAYVGNIVAFIKFRLNNIELGYQIFNYADKPDFNMNELTHLIENKSPRSRSSSQPTHSHKVTLLRNVGYAALGGVARRGGWASPSCWARRCLLGSRRLT